MMGIYKAIDNKETLFSGEFEYMNKEDESECSNNSKLESLAEDLKELSYVSGTSKIQACFYKKEDGFKTVNGTPRKGEKEE